MRSVIWGLRVGLIAATGVGFGPLVVVGVLDGGFQEVDAVGGVGRYLVWAYSAGVLGGLTAGILRPAIRSGVSLRLACGLVLAEVFALQPMVFDMEGFEPGRGSAAGWMGAMAFVIGFAVGPPMVAGLKRSWGERLVGWGGPSSPTERESVTVSSPGTKDSAP
jgi:hypothetical protein